MEIERRFLLLNNSWQNNVVKSIVMQQGYICTEPQHTVRIRLAGELAWLTIKGPTTGISRAEFEFAIPAAEAREALGVFCAETSLQKVRHHVLHQGHTWEIDEFSGCLAGLCLAEIELKSENEHYVTPPWLGREVTNDHRYCNSNLCGLKNLQGLELF